MKGTLVSRFTPSLMKHEDLEEMLVQRHDLANELVESIRLSILQPIEQHHLLIGMRGIGKTHLVSLMYHRVSKMEDLREKVLIAWLREEEWGVTSFLDLLLRILRSLQSEYPAEYKAELFDRVESLYGELPDTAQQKAAELLKDFAAERTLLLLVENLDDLFEGLGDSGQQQFRDYLETYHFCTIFATSQHLFKGIDNKKAPFYNFFNLHYLEKLNLEQVVGLLKNIAKLEDNKELELFIETPKGRSRIEAIHHLAGGNHRVYMIFAEFLTRDSLDRLVKPFLQTLDELTPYYQARMAWLSPQQRKIVEFLCDRRGAVMVKEIAQRCFMTHQTASSQLKQLSGMGYVTSESIGRESYYELQEVLMRFCMDVKKHRGEPISLIVDFLRLWYTQEELKQRLYTLGVIPFPKNYMAVARVDRRSSHPVQEVIIPFPKGKGIRFTPIGKQLVDNSSEKSHLNYHLNLERLPPNAVVEQEYLLRALQAREADDYENLRVAAYVQEIENLKEKKDYVSALNIANKLLAIRGQAHDWLEKASCLHKLERYDEALESLDRASELDPNDWEAWMMQVSVFYKLDRYKEALASCDKAIELEPNRAIIWHMRGIVLNNLERYEKALVSYDKAIELDPHDASVWDSRGSVLENLGRSEESLVSYNKAIELDPNDASVWESRGSVLDDLERYDEALASYNKAIELDPNDVWSWNNRGSVLNHFKRYDEALASLDRAIELESSHAITWCMRGYVLKNLERYEQALASCDKAIELEPNRGSIWHLRGSVLDNLERYEEALTSYDQALQLESDRASSWYLRGHVLQNLGRYEEALLSYDKAIGLELDYNSVWVDRGFVLNHLDHYEEALVSYDKAIELDPNRASIWHLQGSVLNNLGRYEEALASYDKAIELDANYKSAWFSRGWTLDNLGRYEEALISCDKAIELGDRYSYVFFHRAIAILGLNRWDEGLAALDDAFQRIESDEEVSSEDANLITRNLFANTHEPITKTRIISLIAVYEKHKCLSILGNGIVRNIPALMSEMVSDKAARTWLELWQELTSKYEEFQIPIRLLKAAVRYKETKGDRRVLLELPIEERNLLEPLVSTKPE
ncbi:MULTISPECIES: tetratricopeptide repeat protein [unclassified Microcoleus]|uniref:tetratricopeptide repeat protein n=1 Tax=unclassified Microcoleus TaxID=2642155 RepID=UPI002FD11E75